MDAARTILRKTNAKVGIIFHKGEADVAALKVELELAKIDGVQMHYYLKTVQIEEDGIIVDPMIETVHEDGTKEYHADIDKRFKMEADSVIIAIGQGALSNIVKNTKQQIDTNKRGLIEASSKGATTRPGVYAAGDVVSGAKTVVEAVAATKLVADEIDNYVRAKNNLPPLEK